ncbi:unnamed protein product [Absidia cylindrospora]
MKQMNLLKRQPSQPLIDNQDCTLIPILCLQRPAHPCHQNCPIPRYILSKASRSNSHLHHVIQYLLPCATLTHFLLLEFNQAQIQMMSKIIEALQKKQHAVLESPTGSGKTLALLCGALAWLEKEKENRNMDRINVLDKLEKKADDHMEWIDFMDCSDIEEDLPAAMPKPLPRIYFGSRTHKQVAQVVQELKRHTTYRPKMTVLGSREQYCIHERVMKSSNKQEDCAHLTETHSCRYQNHTDKLVKDPKIQTGGSNEIWDIEDLTQLGQENGGCPYYASREIAETAELIICPYNYLVDPIIRKAMNINTADNIIILDEAHNVENISRESGTIELDSDILKYINMELYQVLQNGYVVPAHEILLKLTDHILHWMYDPSHEFESEDDNQHLHILPTGDETKTTLDICFGINASTMESIFHPALELAIKHADTMKARKSDSPDGGSVNEANTQDSQRSTRTHLSVTSLNRLEGLLMVLDYALDDSRKGIYDYRMVLIKKADNFVPVVGSSWERKLGLWCMNPAVVFHSLAKKAHSIILTSGTLTPVTTFEAELDAKFPICLEANHVIKPSQVFVQNIPYGPNRSSLKGVYSTTSKPAYQDDLGEAIAGICDAIPFGILVFVTSYALLDKLYARWDSTGLLSRIKEKKHFVKEPRGGSAESFDKVLKKFYRLIKHAENGVGSHDGAVFLAVYRGKVSEGIDFNNNNCRAVVATGIPYPMWKDTKVILKRSYNDIRWRENNAFLTGDQWYNIQAFRAVNQALGRCIRHRNDWGSILLLEERFLDSRNTQHLSKWIKKLCVSRTDNFETIMADLNEFTQHRLQLDLEAKALLPKQEVFDMDDQLEKGSWDGDTNENQSYLDVDSISISSTETDTDEHRQDDDIFSPTENKTGSIEDDESYYHDALENVIHDNSTEIESQGHISITSSPAGTPTPTSAPPPPSESPPPTSLSQYNNFNINCKNCMHPLLSWPPLPVTCSMVSTDLHYFTNIMEHSTKQQRLDTTEILEVNYVYCMDYEKRFDHNRIPRFDRMNATELELEVQDVKWDPIDGIVYRPYISQCCDQVIGADILSTTMGASEASIALVGKLWLLKDLVNVSSNGDDSG